MRDPTKSLPYGIKQHFLQFEVETFGILGVEFDFDWLEKYAVFQFMGKIRIVYQPYGILLGGYYKLPLPFQFIESPGNVFQVTTRKVMMVGIDLHLYFRWPPSL